MSMKLPDGFKNINDVATTVSKARESLDYRNGYTCDILNPTQIGGNDCDQCIVTTLLPPNSCDTSSFSKLLDMLQEVIAEYILLEQHEDN